MRSRDNSNFFLRNVTTLHQWTQGRHQYTQYSPFSPMFRAEVILRVASQSPYPDLQITTVY